MQIQHTKAPADPWALPSTGLVAGPLWWAYIVAAEDANFDAVPHHLVWDPYCPVELLVQLANSTAPDMRSWAAEHPHLPEHVRAERAHDGEARVRLSLAGARQLSDKVGLTLAGDSSQEVRDELASNSSISAVVLRELVGRVNPSLICGNQNCPTDLLLELAEQVEDQVLCTNRNCPSDLLQKAVDQDTAHRVTLAIHPNCPEQLLQAYVENGDNLALNAVCENPQVPSELLERVADRYPELIGKVAANRQASGDLLQRLADGGDVMTQLMVVSNPSAPEDLVRRLCDENPLLFDGALRNPNCPVAILLGLSSVQRFQARVATHQKCPAHITAWVVQHADEETIGDLCQHGLFDSAATLRAAVSALLRVPKLNTSLLPDIPAEHAAGVIALAGSWTGSLASLIDSTRLLSA